MKIWIVWANNGERAVEGIKQDIWEIWEICDSKEEAEQCIANVREQLRHDEERWNELTKITSDCNYLTSEIKQELRDIEDRRRMVPLKGNNGLPYLSLESLDI